MPWSYVGHVSTIEHHRDDIIVENLPELLGDIVNTERVFQGKVELKYRIKIEKKNYFFRFKGFRG